MRVHFIAIGGSAMHNLAIALKLKGFEVTGSDDEIFDPARGRLEKYGILPDSEGWKPSLIDAGIDAVILGMHARADNPELLKSRELGLKIYSYPEYLYEQSKDKTRVVIAGSHGKTTITSMILHVLNHAGIETDYMVGAQLEGFEVMVKLSDTAHYMILEGDEYLSSALDRRPKFHLYKPDIALISGIAWDHMNVFPTFENYVDQFVQFVELIEENGRLIYCEDDPEVQRLAQFARLDIQRIPYGNIEYDVNEMVTSLIWKGKQVPLKIFGRHNVQNLHGAWLVCRELGVSDAWFLEAIGSFAGASKRLQLLWSNPSTSIFKDFAHSPSKLKATIHAVKEQYPGRELVACLELHTFSSLNKDFLPQYRGCMDLADQPIVYYSKHALALKRLPDLTHDEVREAFSDSRLKIFNDSVELQQYLLHMDLHQRNLLLMSSGNFDGLNPETLHPTP
ncbi:MAG: peptidoglycan synthetase [Bacteroidales bacterium]|nr:peptidoglycan synthetase [Bacteroidales bacterium]